MPLFPLPTGYGLAYCIVIYIIHATVVQGNSTCKTITSFFSNERNNTLAVAINSNLAKKF